MTLDSRTKSNLGYFSHEAAASYPDQVAMFDLSREPVREVAYRELEERMDRVAGLVSARGLEPGDRVAMCVGNRFEFVEVMYGLMRAGVVPVPINVKLGGETIEYILKDSGCRGAIVEPNLNRFMADVVDAMNLPIRYSFAPENGDWLDYESSLASVPGDFDPPELEDDALSFLPYTSGSTGKPKGVALTHEGQLWWIRAVQRYWPSPPGTRVLAAMPLYHKNAMAGAVKPMLHAGGCVVLLPDFKPERFIRALSEYGCERAGGVPAAFSMMLRHRDLIRSLDFSRLQTLVIGSAPVTRELADQISEAFGVTVGESYGLTEGGPVMIGPPLDGRAVPHGSCGVAWPEGEIKLVNAHGEEDDTEGELWVRNPGVTPGYYNLPRVNAERLDDGWLRTGDLFRLDAEGYFYFQGRTDDMFNSGGENIYPKEVENLLLSHPAVVDACVVPVAHAVKGSVPVALVMKTGDLDVTEDELKRYCLDNGPAYAHPRVVEFTDYIPLNGAGKNDRNLVSRMMSERHQAQAQAQGARRKANELRKLMSDSKLLCAVEDGIATLRINRPEAHNAVDLETMRRLEDAMRSMRHDDGVRVIVLTGVGDAAFSSGGDMKEMQSFSAMTGDRLMEAWQAGLDAIETSPKPVICAINGLAYGGGTEIAMACHIRVAVEGASLGQTEIALDHLPGAGGTQRLPRLVPLGFAYEHLLTGEPIDAAAAHRVGLVNHVWTRETFAERTMDLARRIAARSPDAVRYTLDAVREGLKGPLSVGLRLERALASMVIEGADARRGLDDFFAKRRNARSRNS